MPKAGYDRLATRLTRLEERLATRRVLGRWKSLEESAAENVSPERLARDVTAATETMMIRLAARLDADPTHVPSLPEIVRMADKALELFRLVFGEDKLRQQHDAERAASLKEACRNLVFDWAQGHPDLRQEIIDSLKLFDDIP